LLEAFWLDVTTSKDECTCTRLYSVVLTRERPFTKNIDILTGKFVITKMTVLKSQGTVPKNDAKHYCDFYLLNCSWICHLVML